MNDQWKDITCAKQKISGIYKIINKINNKYYVGSSNNIGRRWRKHKYELNCNKHNNVYLQNSWNKHGEENFIFTIIDRLDEYLLLNKEQEYLDIASQYPDTCYNLTFGADRVIHTDRSKSLISQALLGREKSIITRKKLSDGMLGVKNHRYGIPQNKNIYTFQHILTNELFVGTLLEFKRKYQIYAGGLVNRNRRKSCKKWILLE